jgi:cell division protein FtsN
MEKRQAVILLTLVLLVTLISFTLGVWIGRRGGAEAVPVEIVTPPVAAPVPVTVPPPAPPQPEAPPQAAEPPADQLTFYDRLSTGEAPLGSGINLPPEAEKKAVPGPAAKPMAVEAQPAPTTTAAPAAAEAKVAPPPAATVQGGGYVVQVGAFQARKDADALKQKLTQKGYPVIIVEADLGAKGRWYRVRLGPYDKESADRTAQQLQSRDQMKGFVTRM